MNPDGLSGFRPATDQAIRREMAGATNYWKSMRLRKERQAAEFLDRMATEWEIESRRRKAEG